MLLELQASPRSLLSAQLHCTVLYDGPSLACSHCLQ